MSILNLFIGYFILLAWNFNKPVYSSARILNCNGAIPRKTACLIRANSFKATIRRIDVCQSNPFPNYRSSPDFSGSKCINLFDSDISSQSDLDRNKKFYISKDINIQKGGYKGDFAANADLDQSSQSIDLDLNFNGSTQFASDFNVKSVTQDGQTVGKLDGLDVASNGLVSANYTNGLNIALGRLVTVNFNNQNGLKQIGNATYVETSVSGVANVGEAGADGYGTILSGSLERSNVDITEELVNLITAQRNFQANAKTIETNTTLTQAIIQIRA